MDRIIRSPLREHLVERETLNRGKELLVRARKIGREIGERVDKLLGKEHAMPEQMMSTPRMSIKPLPESHRQEIFRTLVEVQDNRMPVAQSRLAVAEYFGISENQLRRIEEEGLENNWPPLNQDN